MLESGLLLASAQLDDRARRFALRSVNLPKGNQARNLVLTCIDSEIGKSLDSFLDYPCGEEQTGLLEWQHRWMYQSRAERIAKEDRPDQSCGQMDPNRLWRCWICCHVDGRELKSIWATIGSPMVQNVLLLHEAWKLRQ